VPATEFNQLTGVRLLYVVNVDWFFISHRLPLLEAAVQRGAVVGVACASTGRLTEIEAHGGQTFELPMTRSGKNPLDELRSLIAVSRIVRRFRPDVVHNVSIKPVLYGTAAARLLNRRATVINAISGFGYAVEARDSLLSRVVRQTYRQLFRSRRVRVVVQNEDARRQLVGERIASPSQIVLIEGSGVDCDRFRPREHVEGHDAPVRVLMASRLLRDKGVLEYCRAAATLRGLGVRFLLAGPLDVGGNPTALSGREVDAACTSASVEYLGEVKGMPELLRSVDIFVLPTYHEGLPKALLEAASTGLALVATDIPGCRPVVQPGVTGELVEVGDVASLAAAVKKLIENPGLRRRYGSASRRLAVERFSLARVVAEFMNMYQEAGTRRAT
jgi:glycosyltransferase involved in cell wall biosynthesis